MSWIWSWPLWFSPFSDLPIFWPHSPLFLSRPKRFLHLVPSSISRDMAARHLPTSSCSSLNMIRVENAHWPCQKRISSCTPIINSSRLLHFPLLEACVTLMVHSSIALNAHIRTHSHPHTCPHTKSQTHTQHMYHILSTHNKLYPWHTYTHHTQIKIYPYHTYTHHTHIHATHFTQIVHLYWKYFQMKLLFLKR